MTIQTSNAVVRSGAGLSEAGFPGAWDAAQGAAATGPKIRGLGRAFLRHGKLLLITVIVLNVLAFYGVQSLTPKYTASADLIVGPREEQVVDLKAVLSGLSSSSDVIESEIQVLRSREIARSVVRKLNLDQMAEFNPALRPPGLKQHLTEGWAAAYAWVSGWTSDLQDRYDLPHLHGQDAPVLLPGERAPVAVPDANPQPLDPLSVPVDRFLAQLDVAAKGRSRVITVGFTSTSATLAAKVPNAVADAYIANQLLAKTNATAQATKWLDERVAELREQLLSADEAVEDYRRRAGIVPVRDGTLLNQEISEASQELMRARERVAVAAGRQAAIQQVNPNAMGLGRELSAARAQQATLEAQLAALRSQVDAGSHSEIGMRALQREADADRNLYDRLLARSRETKVQSGLQQADATVISRAERPEEPSFPKPTIIMPLFFVASCVLGVLLVVWMESLDRGFLDVAELEGGLGIAAVGAIPAIKQRLLRQSKIGTYTLTHPRSLYSESIRNLHTSLMLSGKDALPKTVLFTSALPGEGKSTVALAMARMMASCGKRVLIVDCDLRKPTMHKSFKAGRNPGLTECLSGETTVDVVLRRDPMSSALLLPAGEGAMTAPDLFGSSAMQQLLGKLSQAFDLVLLDGAPMIGVSDARHLSRLADTTVFLVRWQNTRCAAASVGLRQLMDAGANVAGTLLTMIEPKYYARNSPVGVYRRQLAVYLNP